MLKTRCIAKMQKSEVTMCILAIWEENADYWKAVAWLFPDKADNVRCVMKDYAILLDSEPKSLRPFQLKHAILHLCLSSILD
mmetsp:Transcript_1266/g.1615  ORF Transcript_1266/g.1615 Transcript_1266/m.1615 type:complete len:82 (-) Transcript_1266:2664-2909(-)